MAVNLLQTFWFFAPFIIMLSIVGIYCVLVSFNLIRALIGLEIVIKAITLLLIVAGYACGSSALAQSIVITLIVIEAVVMAVAVGVVLGIHMHTNSLDTRKLINLKKDE
jgi:multisubunit Na+/H+ antiporter MnhC subunit